MGSDSLMEWNLLIFSTPLAFLSRPPEIKTTKTDATETKSLMCAVDLSGVFCQLVNADPPAIASRFLELICRSKVTSSVLRLIIILINAFKKKDPTPGMNGHFDWILIKGEHEKYEECTPKTEMQLYF
jgi:hypothetical protein